jgi:hypothetical protein
VTDGDHADDAAEVNFDPGDDPQPLPLMVVSSEESTREGTTTLVIRPAKGKGRVQTTNDSFRVVSAAEAKGERGKSKKQRGLDPGYQRPGRQLVSRETRLIMRWGEFCTAMSPNEPAPYTIGEWLEWIPQRVGRCKLADDSLECAVTAANAYMSKSEAESARAHKMTAEVLTQLMTLSIEKQEDMICLGISYLYLAELFLGIGPLRWNAHLAGVNELLVDLSHGGRRCTDVLTRMFFSGAGQDVSQTRLT